MDDQLEAVNPFAKSRRVVAVRGIVIWSIVVLLITGGLFLFTRSQQSNILILGSSTDVSVAINGQNVQVTKDPRGIILPIYAGKYHIQITRPDNEQFIADVTVASGTTLAIRPTFTLYPPNSGSGTGKGIGSIEYVRSSPDQKELYYLGDNRSRLYRMEIATKSIVPLTELPLSGVTDVEWSTDPNVAIVVQTDGTFLQELPSYDFSTQRLVKVGGTDILSPVWDPTNSNRIAAAYFNSAGEKSLVLTDKHFATLIRKADLSTFTNPKLVWSPDSKYIAVINRSSNAAENNLWIYTLASGDFRAVTSSGSVLNASFSPQSNDLLYETLVGTEHQINVLQTATGNVLSTQVTNTTVQETAWKDDASFYTTGTTDNTLVLHTLAGGSENVSYSGSSGNVLSGIFYFAASQTLVFYTNTTVYTVAMGN